ncbi:MAG: efflux transporter periplasmic adaptor subunit [Methylophaga sp.]|nr:MAG: efflux transporter periplasmic adaptor subunit [Methylophaga sp.]
MNIKIVVLLLLLSSTFSYMPLVKAIDDHNNHADEAMATSDDDHQEEVIYLTSEQMKMAGIVVKSIPLQEVTSTINALGEVDFNRYKTISITPRITAQLIQRHVVLGEKVRKGQVIATLSSVEMANAQGQVLVTDQEWKRVKKLGRKIVSERRYIETQINWELALAKVKAYGMTQSEIDRLIKSTNFSRANGRFDLVASMEGTILKEDYIVGQQIEQGQELNLITDESSLWVIVNVSPLIASQISEGNSATVKWNNKVFSAKVSQIIHSLDEVTRTSRIRLSVENNNDVLHAGLFVNTQIETSDPKKPTIALVLPESAVIRSADGDWKIFVQQGEQGKFNSIEVNVLETRNGEVIIDGLKSGLSVVIEGAFFVQSEIAKNSFSIHNH